MKKTIIALFALTGLAMADTINPITDLEWSWGAGTQKTENNEIYFYGGGGTWAVYGSGATFDSPITLSRDQELTLSYTVKMSGGDSVNIISLVGDSKVVSMGTAYKYQDNDTTKSAICIGTTDKINDDNKYVLKSSGNGSNTTYISSFEELTTPASQGSPYTLTFKVAYSEVENSFIGILTSSLNEDDEAKVDFGSSFIVNKIAATFDGNTQTYVSAMNISVATIPEPTTATLSMLALCGLAARRRRR